MEEQFDICRPDGTPTGRTAPRSVAHREGLWHRSSHLWLFDAAGRVLLQQRHPGKQTDPGRWDIAVAGHVSAGQTPLEAVVREAFEELGLVLDAGSVTFLQAAPKEYEQPGFVDKEWQYLFAGKWNGDVASLVLQPEEVVGARWMDLGDYRSALETGDEAYVGRAEDMAAVWKYLDPPLS